MPPKKAWGKKALAYGAARAIEYGIKHGIKRTIDGVIKHNTGDHLQSRDDVLEQTHPTQEVQLRRTKISKRTKAKIKRKVKFEAKVKKALTQDVIFGTWFEKCNTPLSVNWGGTLGQTDYQEVIGGTNGQLNLHSDNPTSTGLNTYPLQALALLSAQATDTSVVVTSGGTRPRPEPMKVRTTHAEMGMEIMNMYTASLVVDIYTFLCKTDSTTSSDRPDLKWAQMCQPATAAAGQIQFSTASYTTAPTINLRHYTPLDVPEFGKYWQLQDKDQMIIQSQTKVQWRMKHARTPTFTYNENQYYFFKHKSQAVMLVAYPLGDTTIVNGTNILKIFPWKKYHYKRTDTGSGNAGINLAHSTVMAI